VPEPPPGSIDLRAAMSSADVNPIGLALGADGARFVFDENLGLARIEANGTATIVVPMSALPDPGPLVPVQFPITDVVALAPNQFALTAIGDGYLLDISEMTMRQYFCYLPDGTPTSLQQRTDAVTFDPVSQKLYAQPITTDLNGVFVQSQIAAYDRETGVDLEWHAAENDVAATGMAFVPNVGLVLGQGSRLTRFDLANNTSFEVADLDSFGVRSIDGIAFDEAARKLVVVDKEVDALIDIALADIGL
jgi:hypothetical protein